MPNPPDAVRWPASDRTYAYVLLAVLIAYALCFVAYSHVTSFTYRLDDAYINYEYVSHFIAGEGLVFNEGERIWGYTSPLQILILALPVWVGFDPPAVGTYLSIVWIACASLAVFCLARTVLPGLWAALVALYFLTYGHGFDTMGLETTLLVFLQVLFLWAVRSRRFVAAAVLAGLSCLARPDSVLLVLPVLLLSVESRRPRILALFVLPGVLWLLFALGYYGDIFPRPLYAKAQADSPGMVLLLGFFRSTTLRGPLDATLQGLGSWNPVETFLHVAFWLFALVNTRVRRSPVLVYALIVYPCLLIVGYAIIGSAHYWEFFSAYFFFKLGCLVGLFTAVESIARRIAPSDRPGRARIVAGAVTAVWLVVAGAGWVRGFDRIEENRRDHHTRAYEAISRWVNDNVEDGATLQTLEIGALGYLTEVRIIDSVGLVTEGITLRRQQLDMLTIAREFRPDYLLLMGRTDEVVAGDTLHYRTIQFFRNPGYEFSLMRRDDTPDEGAAGHR